MQKTKRAKFGGGGDESKGYDNKDGITEKQVRALVRICARLEFPLLAFSCRNPVVHKVGQRLLPITMPSSCSSALATASASRSTDSAAISCAKIRGHSYAERLAARSS
jgi:hypothetical protein